MKLIHEELSTIASAARQQRAGAIVVNSGSQHFRTSNCCT